MKYILQEPYMNPCFTIRSGTSKTEEEWMGIFPNLQKGDCKIKTDWFREDEFWNYTFKIFIDDEEVQLSGKEIYSYLSSLFREGRIRMESSIAASVSN